MIDVHGLLDNAVHGSKFTVQRASRKPLNREPLNPEPACLKSTRPERQQARNRGGSHSGPDGRGPAPRPPFGEGRGRSQRNDCPARTRTSKLGSKGRCVTITPPGNDPESAGRRRFGSHRDARKPLGAVRCLSGSLKYSPRGPVKGKANKKDRQVGREQQEGREGQGKIPRARSEIWPTEPGVSALLQAGSANRRPGPRHARSHLPRHSFALI